MSGLGKRRPTGRNAPEGRRQPSPMRSEGLRDRGGLRRSRPSCGSRGTDRRDSRRRWEQKKGDGLSAAPVYLYAPETQQPARCRASSSTAQIEALASTSPWQHDGAQ